jgi:purine-nucleoside phosphorylase
VISCAAGGLAGDLQVGDLLIIDDHVDLQFRPCEAASRSPLAMPFYDPHAAGQMLMLARLLKIACRRGCYAGVLGPNYETRAELRWVRQLADVVGMSTIPEARAAHALGMQVAAVATVTNLCRPDAAAVADGDHVAQAASRSLPEFRTLLLAYLGAIAETEPGDGSPQTFASIHDRSAS